MQISISTLKKDLLKVQRCSGFGSGGPCKRAYLSNPIRVKCKTTYESCKELCKKYPNDKQSCKKTCKNTYKSCKIPARNQYKQCVQTNTRLRENKKISNIRNKGKQEDKNVKDVNNYNAAAGFSLFFGKRRY